MIRKFENKNKAKKIGLNQSDELTCQSF